MTSTKPTDLPILVLGSGGHAAVLIDTLHLLGFDIAGCLTLDGQPGETGPLGIPILGDDGILAQYRPETVTLVNGIGMTDAIDARGVSARRHIQHGLQARGYRFASVIHPAATIAASCIVESGAQIMAGAVVQARTHIGTGSIINTRAGVDHDGRIGSFTHIAPGATLCGNVTIGDGAFVGAGTTIIQQCRIGEGVHIAAGMTIVDHVPAGARLRPVLHTDRNGPDSSASRTGNHSLGF